jgi:Raf kinase inhibitor-like YbhB/YbcL family protein
MKLWSDNFADGQPIPADFAFGRPGPDSPCVLSDNRNPHLGWDDVPEGTRSFALLCVDPDVPTVPGTVNRDDVEVPEDQPRTDFVHWAMIDIAADVRTILPGSCSQGVTARGKREPLGPPGARQGLNDYTGWFAGDADMGGDYLGYDGPCPPFNDRRRHRYFFHMYALDVATLDLPERFTRSDLLRAIQGHVLAEAETFGSYTLHPALRD